MGCVVDFNDAYGFDVSQNQEKQKLWLEMLLQYTQADINHLAEILDLPVKLLINVHQGTTYLELVSAENLKQLFLLAFDN